MMITMNQLTKEIFISTIDSLQAQVSRDIDASNAISQVFDTDAVYDNSLLVKAVIKLLQVHFPKDDKGFCEIEHYCFDMNFGKIQGEELVTAEDLWDRLNSVDILKVIKKEIFNNQPVSRQSDLLLKGILGTFGLDPVPSTHPLIDDNLNQDGV